ncbi:MAG: hypothetical protein GY785_18955, partial [Gammaproteobacteria bacterium]|nr:hypothetical protein [Gammaproteobacteria bacterium]
KLDVLSASYFDQKIAWHENITTTLDGVPDYTEGDPPVVLDADVEIFDAELSALDNFDGSSLTLVRDGGPNGDDLFSATGTLVDLTEGVNLVVDSTFIGTVTTNTGGTLRLDFNSNATRSLVNSAMQQIAYSNDSDNPPTSVYIDWIFNDGNTGSQGSGGPEQVIGRTAISTHNVNDDPTVDNLGGDTLAYSEGDGAVIIDQGDDALVSDIDSSNFFLGSLTVSFVSGSVDSEDVLSIRSEGDGVGQIRVDGNAVYYEGNYMGTFAGGSAGAALVFSAPGSGASSPESFTALTRSITYENTDILNPSTSDRVVRFVVDDGKFPAGISADQDVTINVTAVDDDVPTTVNQSITVSEGATNVALTTGHLSSTDADTDDTTLIYTIGDVTNGALTINGSAWASGTNDT